MGVSAIEPLGVEDSKPGELHALIPTHELDCLESLQQNRRFLVLVVLYLASFRTDRVGLGREAFETAATVRMSATRFVAR
jgi:hypothetical protein